MTHFLSDKRVFIYCLVFMLIYCLSCAHYYKVIELDTGSVDGVDSSISKYLDDRNFILHQVNSNDVITQSYVLNHIVIDHDAMALKADLRPIEKKQLLSLNMKGDKYTSDQKGILKEVDIYIRNNSQYGGLASITLPLDQIDKIEVIEHDSNRSTTSYVLGGVGITLGVAVVAAVIVALTKSSCPFVSVFNGQEYLVQGELFGGAVNRRLERADYLPLDAGIKNGEIQLRISNELKERQFTDYADLMVIENHHNSKAYIGPDNKIYQVSKPTLPNSAVLNNTMDVLNAITKVDGISCNFDDTLNPMAKNEIKLSFMPEGNIKKGKLLLSLKNSYWFDYLYGEFTSHFGSYYNKWQKKQSKRPAEEMIQWAKDQQIPLSVNLISSTGIREILRLNTIGPLAYRQVVIPIDRPENSKEPFIIILQTGFMFWELDYAAMDFTEDDPYTITTIKPYSALDEKGNDVLSLIINQDGQFLSQPEAGSYVTLKYKYDKLMTADKSYSLILATKGYYEPIRAYSGHPDLAFLKKFKQPGAMADFSLRKYQFIKNNESVIALKSKP